jgi:hypothetical protein
MPRFCAEALYVCCLVVPAGPSAGTSTILSSLEATTRQAGGHSTIQAFELPDSQLTHRLVSAICIGNSLAAGAAGHVYCIHRMEGMTSTEWRHGSRA